MANYTTFRGYYNQFIFTKHKYGLTYKFVIYLLFKYLLINSALYTQILANSLVQQSC